MLREQFEIHTVSMRAPDRPLDELSDEERDEAQRTFYVNPAGPTAALTALASTLVSSPIQFCRGLWYAMSLARFRIKQLILNLAYFTQATMVGQWMRRIDLKHLHTHYSSSVALLTNKIFGIEISISFHGPDEFRDPVGFWIDEKVAACTFVRSISYYSRSQLMMSSAVRDWGKIEVVHMGVDTDTFAPKPLRADLERVEIMCVGRLAPVKAQRLLIRAFELVRCDHPNVLLHVVGGGPDRQALEEETAARGLSGTVIFHGFTPQDKLHALYGAADIFVLPSFAEGVPGVLMEAMAMEMPCVATWIAGVPELIRNGVDGFLVAPSDAEGFADAILALIRDPELRRRTGKAGRARVLDKFDLRKNCAAFADLFRRSSIKE